MISHVRRHAYLFIEHALHDVFCSPKKSMAPHGQRSSTEIWILKQGKVVIRDSFLCDIAPRLYRQHVDWTAIPYFDIQTKYNQDERDARAFVIITSSPAMLVMVTNCFTTEIQL